MKEVYEVDINKSYFLDDNLNIWGDIEDFHEFHLEDYTGIKDNLESWYERLEEEHNIMELMGDEVISKVVTELEKDIEYYKEKYYEVLEELNEYRNTKSSNGI